MSIKETVDRIIADIKLTKAEHQEFIQKVNADNKIDAEESKQITRLMDLINGGELKVV